MKINLDKIPIKVDDNKIQELYNGDYKKALEDVLKNERYLAVENISLKNKLDKYKKVINKIKEMTKDLFETEYEGIYKNIEDNFCERFYLLEELNKLLEEIE